MGVSRDVASSTSGNITTRRIGTKLYELTDHLGSVRALIPDIKLPSGDTFLVEPVSVYEYDAYGVMRVTRSADLANSYRYGFQGMLRMSEVSPSNTVVNDYSTLFRTYDARTGRWTSHDPILQPWESTYSGLAGNPAMLTDWFGLDADDGGSMVTGMEPPQTTTTNTTTTTSTTETASTSTETSGGGQSVMPMIPMPKIPTLQLQEFRQAIQLAMKIQNGDKKAAPISDEELREAWEARKAKERRDTENERLLPQGLVQVMEPRESPFHDGPLEWYDHAMYRLGDLFGNTENYNVFDAPLYGHRVYRFGPDDIFEAEVDDYGRISLDDVVMRWDPTEGQVLQSGGGSKLGRAISRLGSKIGLKGAAPGLIDESEKLGGHTIDKHVNKTMDFLLDRIANEGKRVVSTFFTKSGAELSALHTIAQNKAAFQKWLTSSSTKNLRLESTLPFSVGKVVSKGGATQLSNNVIFVFKKDAAASGGFKVLTGMLK